MLTLTVEVSNLIIVAIIIYKDEIFIYLNHACIKARHKCFLFFFFFGDNTTGFPV